MQSEAERDDFAKHAKALGVDGIVCLDELLTPCQTAAYMGVGLPTLQRQRTEGTGPKFVKLGKRLIAYRAADVRAWLRGRVTESTADARIRGLAGSPPIPPQRPAADVPEVHVNPALACPEVPTA